MVIHWHWLIVIYLFLGGLGAGAYITSFAAEKGWLGANSGLKRAGFFLASPVVAFGALLLVFDLGQGLKKPWLLLGLLSNFRSVMTWGVYILSAFIIVGLLKAFFVFKNKTAPAALTWAGAILALATGTYTGLLLAVVKAIPFWSTGIMPVLFVVSALSTGLSATALLAPLVERGEFRAGREGQVHVQLIVSELVIAAIFFGIMLAGVKGPVGAKSAAAVVAGSFAPVFWGYFIGLGLLFPLLVYARQYLGSKKAGPKAVAAASLSGSEIALAAQQGPHSHLLVITDFSVLLGGLALRALIVFAALPLWDGITIL